MTDELIRDDFENELREALQVDPSPSFVARTRARVAADLERRRRPARGTFMWFAAALATVVAAMGVWLWPSARVASMAPEGAVARAGQLPRQSAAGSASAQKQAPIIGTKSVPTASALTEPAARPRSASTHLRVSAASASIVGADPMGPEVLVPDDQFVSLARFMDRLGNGQTIGPQLTPTATYGEDGALAPIAPLVRTPPLDYLLSGLGGGIRKER